ncbi:MAG: hypothetical protein NWP69_12750 [Congregibacter sp.]|nr:hypothetical protein [Congregibacter sp.]MDP5071558.1 hypothetical protein [Congregibacter sp.]
MKTLVLQSQRPGVLPAWQRRCCDSVRAWSKLRGFDYSFCGDELFRPLPPALREKLRVQPVVATDLARLLLMREALRSKYERAIWCDADLLIFRDFEPNAVDHSFGREVWVQGRDDGVHSYRRIHNAWLQFTAESPILPFYIDRASKLLERVQMPVVPQFIGPKLLSALHNIVNFNVEERVGMLSPLSMRDLLLGSGPALTELTAMHTEPLCAVNLCASYLNKNSDGVCHSDTDYSAAVRALIASSCPL